MYGAPRAELRRIINTLFETGINKNQTFQAIENFIDRNYIYIDGPIMNLKESMEKAGSYFQWKKDLIKQIKRELKDNIGDNQNNM
jgi:hypothetical protein